MTTALTDVVAEVIPPAAGDVVVPEAEVVAEAPAAEVVAPADYEFALPEGFDASQLKVDDIKAFAKDLGLDPVADKDKAQKILDRVIAQRKDFDTSMTQAKADTLAAWQDEARNDKEIGGDKFDATLAAARGVINNETFVTPGFKTFLEETGLGNHPEMIRVFARLAPHFANDTPVIGTGGTPKGDPLAGLYNHPTSRHS